MTTFGHQVRQLALSVDALDRPQLETICRIVETYTRKTLNIDRTKVFLETSVDGHAALTRHSLGGLEVEITETIKDDKNEDRGQVSLAYTRGKPLWILDKDGRRKLASCDAYSDAWSGLKKIPKFRSPKSGLEGDEDPVKTSIIIPLRRRSGGQVFGVISFSSSDYVETTVEAKEELRKIAEAIAIMLRLSENRTVLGKGTDQAIDHLSAYVQQPLPRLTKPHVFVASSARADKEVMDCVRATLKKLDSRVEPAYWEEIDKPGNIMAQLLETIGACRYGICYFSEKSEDGHYVDNPNVIFEAGMFHGRTSAWVGVASTWILVREESSPEMFFDLKQERTLTVPRRKDGGLEVGKLEADLEQRTRAMIAPAAG